MNNYSKALLGTAAAGAMTMGAMATPAHAQSTEEVIAGAVIIAGMAAILSGNDRDDRYYRDDRRYRGDRRDARRGNGRRAVEQCVRIAENEARRAGYRYADVYEIYDVDSRRDGWRVKGRIAVDGQRGYDRRYDRRDRRGYRDEGKFTCTVEYGRVRDLDFRGVRGLR